MTDTAPPFRKVLVANRGEIALRVVRGCRDLGVESVAICSEADQAAPHVRYADEAYTIGPAEASESYLAIEKILDVARRSQAEAVHPGYGFLAENAEFARACTDAGFVFIGPPPEAIEKMGSKLEARRTLQAAGVPLIPGTIEPVRNPSEAEQVAREIGYPLLIKASAGGGGKGIREVNDAEELPRAIANAQQEARAAFGDDAIYVEKLLRPVRHIEIQLIADHQGQVVTLGERECSIQRRRQKLIEEAPAPTITPELRMRMREAARKVAEACGYVNAGTVECLVYDDDQFAFLEMNTRLQVEHPVTEMVWRVDLVAEQLRVAAGQPLAFAENDLTMRGWAIECRVAAEDPYQGFLPSTGTVHHYREPAGPGIRVDSGLYNGMIVGVHYDPLLAKIIARGLDREQARRRMLRALSEFRLLGLQTNVPFHIAMLQDPNFIAGEIDTDYVERTMHLTIDDRPDHTDIAAFAAASFLQQNGASAGTLSREQGSPAAGSDPWVQRSRGGQGLMAGWRRN